MERYICIHGHFYQPPRENPWLEAIELQDSAHPYHDWNERITAQCYAPNAASRILDGEERIQRIVNNYARISFNFGPTLLSWLESKAPAVYGAVLAADRESARRFSGHGSAMAQPYNHMILPLASARDKLTQVRWGMRDFERRFGRLPEGMWLPETAVDVATLEVLAQAGIRFTLLAPSQARRARRIGGRAWRDEHDGAIDPSRAYELRLPSGRRIQIVFYDGPISRAVAFERLLGRGEDLAHRLLGAFSESRPWPQLAHIATDGETYGHHHRHGEMALAYALEYIESNGLARLTNYGEYLERHPPDYQVEIHENSSWSCVHGVERWRADCGCNSGGHPGWRQGWRGPLREAFDWLRDEIAGPFEEAAGRLLLDPWLARDDYIEVVLDRSPSSRRNFLARHATRALDAQEEIEAWKLLELQRHAMLMYTSCGWFFDELSGLETVQVLQYASRALQLAEEALGHSLEEPFLERLDRARSNIAGQEGGRRVYDKLVRPAAADHLKVGGHYGISSLFRKYDDPATVYCYTVTRRDYRSLQAGEARLALGRAEVASRVTGEAREVSFGVLHWGQHNLSGGVREAQGDEAYGAMAEEVSATFSGGELSELVRLFDEHFGISSYSVRSLFKDEQRSILDEILRSSVEEAESAYRQIYEHRVPMLRVLTALGVPLPRAFRAAAEVVLNAYLRTALESAPLDHVRIASLMDQAQLEGVPLDYETLGFALTRTIEVLAAGPLASVEEIDELDAAVKLARALPFEVRLWQAQNRYHEARERHLAQRQEEARRGDEQARAWIARFDELGGRLGFRPTEAAP